MAHQPPLNCNSCLPSVELIPNLSHITETNSRLLGQAQHVPQNLFRPGPGPQGKAPVSLTLIPHSPVVTGPAGSRHPPTSRARALLALTPRPWARGMLLAHALLAGSRNCHGPLERTADHQPDETISWLRGHASALIINNELHWRLCPAETISTFLHIPPKLFPGSCWGESS